MSDKSTITMRVPHKKDRLELCRILEHNDRFVLAGVRFAFLPFKRMASYGSENANDAFIVPDEHIDIEITGVEEK